MWKALAFIALGIVALLFLYPLIKGLIWIGIVLLALYGAFALFVDAKTKTPPGR